MKLIDANVLLYAVNERAAHHRAARTWLDSALSGEETVGFAWISLLAFIRISSQPAIFPRPLSADASMAQVIDWLGQPTAVVLSPTERHATLLAGLLATAGTAGNLVNDAHLAALALEYSAEVISFDADFSRFTGVAWRRP